MEQCKNLNDGAKIDFTKLKLPNPKSEANETAMTVRKQKSRVKMEHIKREMKMQTT